MNLNNPQTFTPASPKVRKFARELGVNINEVTGSERQGRVTEDDIKLFILNRLKKKRRKQD